MTTAAWDGKMLAVDSQLSRVRCKTYTNKVYNIGDRVVIGAGDVVEIQQTVSWITEGSRKDDKPTLEDCEFLILDKSSGKCYYMDHRLIESECKEPESIGSGWQFALGAMMAGKNATRAVEIASSLDIYTGGTIQTIKPTRRK